MVANHEAGVSISSSTRNPVRAGTTCKDFFFRRIACGRLLVAKCYKAFRSTTLRGEGSCGSQLRHLSLQSCVLLRVVARIVASAVMWAHQKTDVAQTLEKGDHDPKKMKHTSAQRCRSLFMNTGINHDDFPVRC